MSRFLIPLLIVFALLLPGVAAPVRARVESCAATPAATPGVPQTFPVSARDDLGREVTITAAPERIISLAPSNTEILYALDLGSTIVALDAYSDYPPAVADVPRVGDYVDPDLEEIVAFAPDLVLLTSVHEATLLPRLEEMHIPAAVLEPLTLDATLADIGLVGALTGATAASDQLTCQLEARIAAVERALAGAPAPRVFFELSPDLYTAGKGSYIDDLLTHARGTNIVGSEGGPWPQISAEALIAADPEVILLADHEAGVTPESVAERPGWDVVSAVKNGRIVSLDSNLVARPGPRVVDGLDAIARALHPDLAP
ncbi:MAG: ABC transporter substrate-binding protein [Thermomicrobiales bacterium]